MGTRTARMMRTIGGLAIATVIAASVMGGAAGAAPSGKAAYDPKGVLRWATDLSGPGEPVFDPAQMTVSDSGTALGQLLYDTLLRKQPDGSLTPQLAAKATIDDPQTLTVELRPGLKFQDGTPLDAAALAFTILRNRDTTSVAFAPQIHDVTSVDVVNPTTVKINLSKPEAGAFYPLLAGLSTMPVSPTAVKRDDPDPIANPLGAGPFRVAQYDRLQKLVLEKNPQYWNAKQIKLGGIEYVNAPAGPTAVNSLQAGTVDVIGSDVSQVPGLEGGNIAIATASSPTSLLWFPLCKNKPPLDDPKVRQALNYALDRDAINEGLAEGKGEPAWSLVPPSSSLYASKLDEHFARNPKKARTLLKQAGYPDGVKLSLIPSPGLGIPLAEIAQQSWAEAGIDVEIVPSGNIVQDLFVNQNANMGSATVVRGGLDALQTIYTPGNLGDLCNYEDPELTGIINELASLPSTDPAYAETWARAQEFVIDNALSVYGVWLPAVIAYDSDRLGGVRIAFPGVSPYPDFFSAYVKK